MTSETSANFDQENVQPFFERLARHPSVTLSATVASSIAAAVAAVPVSRTGGIEVPVVFGGRSSVLTVEIFKDDIDAPDLYFFAEAGLIDIIDKELAAFFEELGL